jgi:NAD(P)-dependent dehydrogenase (short-subunit alcohol dehydrogenase family)
MTVADIFDLTGRIAVVTGAGGGLGRALCEAMAEAGADVVCADINEEAAAQAGAAVTARGRRALSLHCDVTKEEDVKAMIESTLAFGGRLDILFNNAGISHPPTLLHDMEPAEWNRVLGINLNGVYYCAREALKVMVKQGSGKLINIASIWGMTGSARIKPLPAYTASKGAVVNLTRELGLEYAPFGINVNGICPGFFATGIGNGAFSDPAFVNAVSAVTALGRVGQPSELKGAAIFLASAASDYMCGHMLVLDGGALAH